MALCAALVAAQAAAHAGTGEIVVGGIPSSAVAAALGAGLALATWQHTRPAPPAAWLIIAAVLPAAALAYAYAGVPAVVGMLPVAASEEAVFRVAVPLLVAAAFTSWASSWPAARGLPAPVAVILASVVFTLMPGHVAQWSTSPTGPAPWIALSVLWSGMLLRGFPLAAVMAHHALVDLAALAVANGAPAHTWTVFLVVPVLAAVILEYVRDRRERDVPDSVTPDRPPAVPTTWPHGTSST